MLSNLFIYLIGLFLAIQGVKSRVGYDPNSCAGRGIENAINEVVAMAGAAITRTSNAFKGQSTGTEQRAVFDTYSAYFGINDDANTVNGLLCISSLPKIYVINLTNT
jgi:hypothetical protein